MKSAALLTLLFVVLQAPVTVQAQIVNIESARFQTDTVGWKGSGGANFSMIKNTRQIILVNLEAHLQHKTEKDLWLILGDYGFLKGGDDKFISNSFGHIRYNRKLNSWLRWEAFSQIQSNLITRIRSRYLIGTGPRFKIFSLEKFRLYAASLIMFEHEREFTHPVTTHKDVRSSSYISFTFLPSETIDLISTTFFQPRVDKFGDNRIFNQTTLQVKASKRFSLHIKYNYLHDTAPAADAPGTTYFFTSGFDLTF